MVLPKLMRSGEAPASSSHLDFLHRCGVEARAEIGQQLQNLRLRIGLDGVEDARVRQCLGKGIVIVANDIKIDNKARTVVTAFLTALRKELLNTFSHRGIPSNGAALAALHEPHRWKTSFASPRFGAAAQAFWPSVAAIRDTNREPRLRCYAVGHWVRLDAARPCDFVAIVWKGEFPDRTPGNERQASSVSQFWKLAETKKPGPSLL